MCLFLQEFCNIFPGPPPNNGDDGDDRVLSHKLGKYLLYVVSVLLFSFGMHVNVSHDILHLRLLHLSPLFAVGANCIKTVGDVVRFLPNTDGDVVVDQSFGTVMYSVESNLTMSLGLIGSSFPSIIIKEF